MVWSTQVLHLDLYRYEISYVDTLCISINDDVKSCDFFSWSKMIKLVVCSLVLLIIIKSSHQDQEDEEIQKRFNNAHLLRGRRRYLDQFRCSFPFVFRLQLAQWSRYVIQAHINSYFKEIFFIQKIKF